jgi:hypothetical protein
MRRLGGRPVSNLVSFAGLVGVFIVAYLCHRWSDSIYVATSQDFKIERLAWLGNVTSLIVAVAVVAPAWYVMVRADKSIWVAAGFALIGLAVTFEYAIQVSAGSVDLPWFLEDFLGMGAGYAHSVGAFVAVIGIASFVLPRRRSKPEFKQDGKQPVVPGKDDE